jgi:hypothetical protein
MTKSEQMLRKRELFISATCALLCLLGRPSLSQPRKSAIDLPTVVAVSGDDDGLFDWASEFLTGCEYVCELPGTTEPKNCSCYKTVYHAPLSWYKSHMHLDGTVKNYATFYRDKRVKGGRDESSTHGLEHSWVVFYSGEGNIDSFDARNGNNKKVALKDFSLGDGNVRYIFMLSCNVFAHGEPTSGDFLSPDTFDISKFRSGSSKMANAFDRWGTKDSTTGVTPLNPRLRLACGGSSQIGGAREYSNYPTHLFWYYSSVRRLNPGDSWLVSLYVHNVAEPLCMSRGDNLKGSGLRDRWFQREPLVEGDAPAGFVFIEYPVEGRSNDPLVQAVSQGVPAKSNPNVQAPDEDAKFPVLQTGMTAVPSSLNIDTSKGAALTYGSVGGAASRVAQGLWPALFHPGDEKHGSLIQPDDVCVENNRASGSVEISWRPNVVADDPNISRDLDAAANGFLLKLVELFQESGPTDGKKTFVRDVTAVQMKVDPVEATNLLQQPVSHQDGCLYVRQTRSVEIEPANIVPIFGEGSETFIGRCPAAAIRFDPPGPLVPTNPCERAGSPLAVFVYTNRRIMFGGHDQAKVKLRPKDAVIQEARSMLGVPPDQVDRYHPVNLRLGYRAAPVHCEQRQMYLVYEVDFTADDPLLPPRTIEVPAQDLTEARTMEDTWKCSPE